MSGYTVRIDLPDHKRYDTWQGVTIGPILVNGSAPANTLTSCRLYFRDSTTGVLGYGLTTLGTAGYGTITITNAATWEISIPAQLLDLDVGDWYWDFETTDSAGNILTFYDGILTVTLDASYDD